MNHRTEAYQANRDSYPGRTEPAWSAWVRECSDRLDACERKHHEDSLARLREWTR